MKQVPQAFQRYFRTLMHEAWSTLIQRQEAYGPTNIEQLGAYGVFSRIAYDKIGRISNSLNGTLVDGRVEVDPSWYSPGTRDALIDIANYALIMISLGEGKWSETARAEESADFLP